MDYRQLIDKCYPEGPLREIYLSHCRQVADKALAIAHAKRLPLTDDEIEEAAMLHDIGIVMTDAPGIHCYGTEPYIAHGVLGAKIIREAGLDEKYAQIAERHTGAGITADDIARQHLPLPEGEYCPQTLLERLICYADKFFSKSGDGSEKSLERIIRSLSKFDFTDTEGAVARFMELHRQFGQE